ncbi:MAG: type II/IV secretion system ATPase subunit [Thermoplasmata archaeon]
MAASDPAAGMVLPLDGGPARPGLSPEEERALREVRRRLLDVDRERPERREEAVEWLRARVAAMGATVSPALATEEGRARVTERLVADLLGLGPIDRFLADPAIEDVACDGVGIPVFVHHRQLGWRSTDVVFRTDAELDGFVRQLAQRAGRSISDRSPLLEATLPGGTRLHATLGRSVTPRGSTFTLRRLRESARTPFALVASGTMSAELAAYLWLSVEAGRSLLVIGGTASGKTTTLNALLEFVPPDRKIVSLEDTREIRLLHEHWTPMQTRDAPASRGAGDEAIDLFALLAAALRQRPAYLVVGEVRGREAHTVFQAAATGKTCLATLHADSLAGMIRRLESPPIGLPRPVLAAVPTVVVQRQAWTAAGPVRRLAAVVEIDGVDPDTDEIIASPVFRWDPAADRHEYVGRTRLVGRIAAMRALPPAAVEAEWRRRADWLARAAARLPDDERSFAVALAAYRRDPVHAGAAGGPTDHGGPAGAEDAAGASP